MEETSGKCLAGPGEAAPNLVTKHPSGPSRSPLLDKRRRITGEPVVPAFAFPINFSAASCSLSPMNWGPSTALAAPEFHERLGAMIQRRMCWYNTELLESVSLVINFLHEK